MAELLGTFKLKKKMNKLIPLIKKCLETAGLQENVVLEQKTEQGYVVENYITVGDLFVIDKIEQDEKEEWQINEWVRHPNGYWEPPYIECIVIWEGINIYRRIIELVKYMIEYKLQDAIECWNEENKGFNNTDYYENL